MALRQAYSTYPGNSQTGVSVQAGDLIVVAVSYGVASLSNSGVTDNAAGGSNTYATGPALATAMNVGSAETYYAIAKATETLTVTYGSSPNDVGIHVHAVQGPFASLATVLDASNTAATAAGTSSTGASIATSNANDYLFSFWWQENTGETLTENGQGFTKQSEQTGHTSATFDRDVSATGTYNDAVTSTTNQARNNIIAAFKYASSGAYTITCQSGSYSVSGQSAGINYTSNLRGTLGQFDKCMRVEGWF